MGAAFVHKQLDYCVLPLSERVIVRLWADVMGGPSANQTNHKNKDKNTVGVIFYCLFLERDPQNFVLFVYDLGGVLWMHACGSKRDGSTIGAKPGVLNSIGNE